MTIPLKEQFVCVDEYGGAMIATIAPTIELCKAAHDRLPFWGVRPPGYPVTADDWINQGSLAIMKIHMELIEGSDYFKKALSEPV